MVPHDAILPAGMTVVALLIAPLFPDLISWLLGLAVMLLAFWVTGTLRHGWRRPKGET